MLSEQRLLDALPGEEIKLSDLARLTGSTRDVVLELAKRLQKRGCVRMRKPFLRQQRVLKLKPTYDEATKVIAVMNVKGGVGKTITALNLAACLADMGHRTLLVDLDPQASATAAMKVTGKTTVYSVLVGTKAPAKAVHKTHYENLWMMPSELSLAGAEVEIMGVDAAYRLWEVLEWIKDEYRYIIIDCPPSLSMLSVNALAAANSVIVPVQCDQFALESLEKMMETINTMKAINEDIRVEGILLTMHDLQNEMSASIASKIRQTMGEMTYEPTIARDGTLSEAASKGMPLIHYSRDSQAAKAYMSVSREVASNGG